MEWSARCAESGTAARRADGACRGSVGTPDSTVSPPAETRGGERGHRGRHFRVVLAAGTRGHGRDVALRLKIDRSN